MSSHANRGSRLGIARLIARLVLTASSIAVVSSIFATTADQTADRVLGQIGLTYNTPNFGGRKALSQPVAAVVDNQGHLYVVDQGNNRVLGFASAASFLNGAPADLVIGQKDFYSNSAGYPTVTAGTLNQPVAAATDPAGNLYVSDFIDDRVLEYDAPFASGYAAGEPASIVFGNKSSTSESSSCMNAQPPPSADNLCGPTGVASDPQGNLFVTDSANNRVLVYLNPKAPGGGTPGTPGSAGDTTADVVFGQNNSFTNFLPCTTNPQPTTASSLCIPYGWVGGLAVDQNGDLFVADAGNARVLKYNTPLDPNSGEPGAGDTVADLVFGQADFTSAVQCSRKRRASARVLCFPTGVAVDSAGHVYISDASRVLEYEHPVSSGPQKASRVFGQKNFTSDSCHQPSARTLCAPSLAATDAAGRLYVPDSSNNRVLAYNSPLSSSVATRELGQLDFVHNGVNFPSARSLLYPFAATVDAAGHLYVIDSNRVLGWNSAAGFANGQSADLVIGQPDFYSTGCHLLGPPPSCALCVPTKRRHGAKPKRDSPMMCSPQGLAADSAGNLFVSDTGNNRVLLFADPFNGCEGKFPCVAGPPRAIIDGKGDAFACRKPSRETLCAPGQLAIDQAGNLWVADYSNSRVLLLKQPLASSSRSTVRRLKADLVIGQGSSGTRFTSRECDNGDPTNPIPSADTLCYPDGLAVDRNVNVYVSDSVNGRVLEYDNPLSLIPGTPGVSGSPGDVTADLAFDAGGSFTTRNCGETAEQLCVPAQLAVDFQNNLYVVDTERVLEYLDPTAPGGGTPGVPGSPGDITADVVFGQQGSFTAASCNGNDISTIVNATTLCQPQGVAVDSDQNVYIVDSFNNRVLAFTYASTTAAPPPAAP